MSAPNRDEVGRQATDWKRLAVHALHDLRVIGVPIERITCITPEALAEVDAYDREIGTFS